MKFYSENIVVSEVDGKFTVYHGDKRYGLKLRQVAMAIAATLQGVGKVELRRRLFKGCVLGTKQVDELERSHAKLDIDLHTTLLAVKVGNETGLSVGEVLAIVERFKELQHGE